MLNIQTIKWELNRIQQWHDEWQQLQHLFAIKIYNNFYKRILDLSIIQNLLTVHYYS